MTLHSFWHLESQAAWRHSTERDRAAWLMRQSGLTWAAIGLAGGCSGKAARLRAMRAEQRMEKATEVYGRPVPDPIVYGVCHEFTPEGRVRLR
jgi:hypothetical protein